MRFRTFILPWLISILVIGTIEAMIYAVYRPTIVERNDFLVLPIQRFAQMLPERWIIWNKVRKLPDLQPIAVQAGDSSGLYGIMPDVVSQYIGGQQYLDLSCCANQGFRGYLVLLETALKKYRSLKYAVVYVSPTVTLGDSQWISNAPDVFLSPGVTIPMLSDAMYDNFLSYRKYLYPPSNSLRPRVYEKVLFGRGAPRIPPAEREPNPVFERADVMPIRNGYMIEHDLQIDIPAGCAPILAPRDPSTQKTYWELFARAFTEMASEYHVTPVLIFGPTAFAACELNQEFRNTIANLRTEYPSLRIPLEPIETWPPDFFSVPAHVQHTFAIEASRRVGRVMRALMNGHEMAENLVAEGPLTSDPTMHVIDATVVEECGWAPDYKEGYIGDVTAPIRDVCDGKTSCSYKKGSDPGDVVQPANSCKAVYSVDYKCEGEPVRSFREEGRNLFGGILKIDCRNTSYLARDPMPYGIQIAYSTFGGDSGGPIGNATTPVAAHCQGRTDCTLIVDPTKLGVGMNASSGRLQIVYRCDRELATRVVTVPVAESGQAVRLSCLPRLEEPSNTIAITSATYGGECGAARGNANYVIATLCEGKTHCNLPALHATLAKAAPTCAKDLSVEFRCGRDPTVRVASLSSGDMTPPQLECAAR
jgi:hypothetical protein